MDPAVDSSNSAGKGRFHAFISYRHLDNSQEGRRWAEWLHHGLENYTIPASLRGKLNRSSMPIPKSLYPIFRDEEEMATARPLGVLVEEGLQRSDWLIVLCSPQSANSSWLNSEVRRFQELGKGDRILPVILEGEPNAAARAESGEDIDPALECLPHLLRRTGPAQIGFQSMASARQQLLAFKQDLAADFRPEGSHKQGFTSPGAYRAALERENIQRAEANRLPRSQLRALEDRYSNRLKLMRLKIIAGLLDVDLSELTKREAEARVRRARMIATIALAVVGVIAVLTSVAMWQSVHRQELLKDASRADFAEAQRLTLAGEWQAGVAHLDRSLRYWPRNAAAAAQLWLVLRHEHGPSLAVPELQFQYSHSIAQGTFSRDGSFLAVTDLDAGVHLFDLRNAERSRFLRWPGWRFYAICFFDDSRRLVVVGEEPNWRVIDLPSFSESQPPDDTGPPFSSTEEDFSSLSPNGRLILTTVDQILQLRDVVSGKLEWALPAAAQPATHVSWSGDSRRFAVAWGSRELRLYDCIRHEPSMEAFTLPGDIGEITLDTSGSLMAVRYGGHADISQWRVYKFPDGSAPVALPNGLRWVAFVPHSTLLLYRLQENTTYLRNFAGDSPRVIDLTLRDASGALFSSDGRKIVLYSSWGEIEPISSADPHRHLTLQRLAEGQKVLALSADGRHIASYDSLMDNGHVTVWSIPDYLTAFPTPPPNLRPEFHAIAPDGAWEATTILQRGVVHSMKNKQQPFNVQWSLNPSARVTWSNDSRFLWHYPQFGPGPIPWRWEPPAAATAEIRRICILLGGVRLDENGVLAEADFHERVKWRDNMQLILKRADDWSPFLDWWLAGRPMIDPSTSEKDRANGSSF